MVLEDGIEAKPLQLTSVDLEFIAQRRLGVEEITRFFRVPPFKVGATEIRGIDIEEINTSPPHSFWTRFFGWGFSAAILSLFVAGFFYSGGRTSIHMMLSWSVITAICAMIGAMILLAHPFTILASALSAPIATLHPLIATGWVAGLTEATFRKPQVRDFLDLKDDITTVKGFFRNRITRILILVVVVNLTTSIGTFVAIPVMMKYFL